jgi:IS5 family transposase
MLFFRQGKDHIKIDDKSKLIDTYRVTSAEVHDSQPLESLLGESDEGHPLWVDSAYIGASIDKMLTDRKITPKITERAFRNKLLTEEQQESNRVKSRVRSRVEHVFGFVTYSMGDFRIRSIGKERAVGIVGLIKLVYNMCRYEQLLRLQLLPVIG